jgi:hypothetical protein
MVTKKTIPVAILVVASGSLLYIANAPLYYPGKYNDDAIYILAAQQLAKLKYTLPSSPRNNEPIGYLPGFPLMLSPMNMLFYLSKNLNVYRIPTLIFALFDILLLYIWLFNYRTFNNKVFPYFILLIFILSPITVRYSTAVMSEMPYISLSLIYIILFEHYTKMHNAEICQKLNAKHRTILYAILLFLILVRPIGTSLMFATLSYLLYSKYKKERIYFSLYTLSIIILLSLWLVLCSLGQQEGLIGSSLFWFLPHEEATLTAKSGLFNILSTLWLNLLSYGQAILYEILSFKFLPKIPIISLFAILLISYGIYNEIKRNGLTITELYFLWYFAILLPLRSLSPRYLLPISPFIALYYTSALQQTITKFKKPFLSVCSKAICYSLLLITLALYINQNVKLIRKSFITYKNNIQFLPIKSYGWVKKHSSEEDIFLSLKPPLFYLYTGRRTLSLIFIPISTLYKDNILHYLAENNINYIFLEEDMVKMQPMRDKLLARALSRYRKICNIIAKDKRYKLVYTEPGENVKIYEVPYKERISYLKAYKKFDEIVAQMNQDKTNIKKITIALENFISDNPYFTKAYNFLSNLYLMENEIQRAIGVIKKGIAYDEDYAYLYATLGLCYSKLGRKKLSLEQWELAREKATLHDDISLVEKLNKDIKELEEKER